MNKFTARIHKVGINPCIDVPARISRDYGRRGYVPVLARLGEGTFQATLVPVGGGRHRLCLNLSMRQAAGRDMGDRVTVGLSPDTASRVLAVPADLGRALRTAGGLKAFLAEIPSHRKEIIRWIGDTKNCETRRKRIAKATEHFKPSGTQSGRRSRR